MGIKENTSIDKSVINGQRTGNDDKSTSKNKKGLVIAAVAAAMAGSGFIIHKKNGTNGSITPDQNDYYEPDYTQGEKEQTFSGGEQDYTYIGKENNNQSESDYETTENSISEDIRNEIKDHQDKVDEELNNIRNDVEDLKNKVQNLEKEQLFEQKQPEPELEVLTCRTIIDEDGEMQNVVIVRENGVLTAYTDIDLDGNADCKIVDIDGDGILLSKGYAFYDLSDEEIPMQKFYKLYNPENDPYMKPHEDYNIETPNEDEDIEEPVPPKKDEGEKDDDETIPPEEPNNNDGGRNPDDVVPPEEPEPNENEDKNNQNNNNHYEPNEHNNHDNQESDDSLVVVDEDYVNNADVSDFANNGTV